MGNISWTFFGSILDLFWALMEITNWSKRDLKGFKCMTVSLDVFGNFLILFETFKYLNQSNLFESIESFWNDWIYIWIEFDNILNSTLTRDACYSVIRRKLMTNLKNSNATFLKWFSNNVKGLANSTVSIHIPR